MDIPHSKNKILSALEWHVGSFKLLIGIASLGLATAILAMSNKGRTGFQNSDASLRLIHIILANAFIFFLFSKRSQRNAETLASLRKHKVLSVLHNRHSIWIGDALASKIWF